MANDSFLKMTEHMSTLTDPTGPIIEVSPATVVTSPIPGTVRVKRRRPWKLYGYLLAALGILGLAAYGYCTYTYGKGGYSGYVRMFHSVGAIKTWEGELDKRKLGGSYNKEDIFEFSVADDAVAEKIQTAEQSGEWVTVHYKEYLCTLPWRGKTRFVVHDVTHKDRQLDESLREQAADALK